MFPVKKSRVQTVATGTGSLRHAGLLLSKPPKLLKMFGGGLAPYALILNALWLGTLLRVSRAALYTNDWAIKIKADAEAVRRIAEKHGFANLGQVGDGRQRLVGARLNSNSSNILFLWSPSAVS